MANVPHKSHDADGFDGLLRSADGHLSSAVRLPCLVARSATHPALEHNGTPDGGVDRTTASRGFPWDEAARYLVRDRDTIFGKRVGATIQGMGIEAVITAPRSPWQNPFVERLIGSIRRECLDHVIVWNEGSLPRILQSYFEYYERSRTHLALSKDAPVPRPVEKPANGRIVELAQVGGLHHRYQRCAA